VVGAEKRGNIIMHFPSSSAVRELIFCAHYDSKTDFWGHIQRAMVYQFIPVAVEMSVLLVLWTFFVRRKGALSKKIFRIITLAPLGIPPLFTDQLDLVLHCIN
jgi:ABC-type sugar transport system permease subunit